MIEKIVTRVDMQMNATPWGGANVVDPWTMDYPPAPTVDGELVTTYGPWPAISEAGTVVRYNLFQARTGTQPAAFNLAEVVDIYWRSGLLSASTPIAHPPWPDSAALALWFPNSGPSDAVDCAVTYTNQDGTPGRTATSIAFSPTFSTRAVVRFELSPGDTSVRSIQSVDFPVAPTNPATLIAYRRLFGFSSVTGLGGGAAGAPFPRNAGRAIPNLSVAAPVRAGAVLVPWYHLGGSDVMRDIYQEVDVMRP